MIALDFDGVVWDSVDEAFEQAYRVWIELFGMPGTTRSTLLDEFRRARWQCRDGHDFYLVMRLLVEQSVDAGKLASEKFRRLRAELGGQAAVEQFVTAFYNQRDAMRQHQFQEWLSLQRPFPGMVETLCAFQQQGAALAIATTKDAPSARSLLESAGLHGIPVFGRETSLNKVDHMKAIAKRFHTDTGRIVFVDDLLENLLPLRPLKVHLVLADWGYNTPGERVAAQNEGIPVASLDSFASMMMALYLLKKRS